MVSPSRPSEGRLAIVTKCGAGCGGRVGVARRATHMRTAKSCGPDPPTLGSSWRVDPPATVANKPGHRGEHVIGVKTIAQGKSDCSGEPVVINSCAFYFCTRGYGCIEHPAFPAPSVWEGKEISGKPRAYRAARSRNCIYTSLRGANGSRECAPDDRLRDEAIHPSACGPMDCFASLAMTWRQLCHTGSAIEYFTWESAKLDSIEAMPSSRVSLVFRNAS